MAATNMWFSEQTKNHSFLPLEGEDIAVWLLVSVISDSDVANGYISGNSQKNSVKWWGLALLVNNMVILGTELDPRYYEWLITNIVIGLFDGLWQYLYRVRENFFSLSLFLKLRVISKC